MRGRRQFIQVLPLIGFAGLWGRLARAADPTTADSDPFALPLLSEADPETVRLGYVTDAGRADRTRFNSYLEDQTCANCFYYQGKVDSAAGSCGLLPARVMAKGWCGSYGKKLA